MGRRTRHALLVGGAVPGLLEDIALSGAPGHAGTIDADILLDPNVFGSDDYATLAERLLERGYRYRRDADGNDLQFSFEVDAEGHAVVVDFRLVDVPGFVVLKAHAFEDRQAPNDAYDLCYVLAYAKEGPAAIADRLARHAGDSEVARAVDCLRTAFASPDTAGSVAVAVFEEARGEEAEQQAALAYAVVQSFLKWWDAKERGHL